MATDYYMGKGMMMNYGETYEMKKEELVKVLDEYVEALRRVEAERDVLQKEVLRLKYPDADPFELDLLNKT
jgi:hypothetical protein